MKRWVCMALVGLMVFCLTACSYGVSQEDYDAVVAERDALKAEYDALNSKYTDLKTENATIQISVRRAEQEKKRQKKNIK